MLCLIWLLECFGFKSFDEFLRIPFLGVVRSLLEGVLTFMEAGFGERITEREALYVLLLLEF